MVNITIDEKEYDTEAMSEEALGQLGSLQYVDKQLGELQMRIAAYQTARNGYANALRGLLENDEEDGKDEDSANISLPDNLTFD
jgi:hypothetical protein